VLRGKAAAFDFVSSLENAPALSVVTITELVAGCRNVRERRQIDRLLSHYVIHDINRDVAGLAGDYVRRYGPSHGTDPVDALIAATAETSSSPLVTLNVKHFPMFAGLTRPYPA
jgi:predicted nucleic acid-binding protein